MAAAQDTPKRSRTESATAQRVRRCFELMLEGYTPTEIWRKASDNFRLHGEQKEHDGTLAWSVSDRTVRSYCSAARKDLEAIQALKKEQALGSSLARRERMYRRAMELDRVNTALRVQDSIDRLNGLKDYLPVGGAGDDGPRGILLPGGALVLL